MRDENAWAVAAAVAMFALVVEGFFGLFLLSPYPGTEAYFWGAIAGAFAAYAGLVAGIICNESVSDLNVALKLEAYEKEQKMIDEIAQAAADKIKREMLKSA